MAKATYPYVAYPLAPNAPHPQGTIAYRPVAVASITASSGESIRFAVLPDSGADACLFPLSVAMLLKLDILKLPSTNTGGVGNLSNLTYYDSVTIDLGSGIEFKAFCGFTAGMDKMGMGLLGQAGFFEYYRVEFLNSRKIFTIETV